MSGGSYDYFCFKAMNFAEEIQTNNDPKRIAFKKLAELFADASKAIEWEDSGDTGKENTDKTINVLFNFLGYDSQLIWKAAAYDEFKVIVKKFMEE